MRITARSTVLALTVVLSLPALTPAATVEDVYQAEIPVQSRSESERAAAVRDALGMVLVKLTGDRRARAHPALAGLQRAAQDYVQQYQYLSAPAHDTGERRLLLRVRFDQRALDGALAPTGLPLWGRERPVVVVWLAVDDGTGSMLVGGDDPHGHAEVLRRRAALRGIPVILPLLDLEDAARLGAAPDGGPGDVIEASRRYGADAVLAGTVRTIAPGLWEAHWTLHAQGERITWRTDGDLAEAVIDEGIDGAADALAERFAQPAGEAPRVELVVYGMRSAEDYARVQHYLQDLDEVTQVQVSELRADQVVFALHARGGGDALARTIALGQVLTPVGAAATLGVYRLAPYAGVTSGR